MALIPAYVDPAWSTGGYFIGDYAPRLGRVAVGPYYSPRVVEHEYHHAWDLLSPYPWYIDLESMRVDLRLLAQDQTPAGRVASRVLREIPERDTIHWNHYLIHWLGYDYAALPDWYRLRRFSYAEGPTRPFTGRTFRSALGGA